MGGAMPLFILIGIAFVGWLMWSSWEAKQNFLLIMWGSMIVIGTAHLIYLALFK